MYYNEFDFVVTGPGKVHPGAWTEQSQVVVETVTKSTTTQNYSALQQRPESDASKVVTRGAGLNRAFPQKEQTFQVDASKAGKYSDTLRYENIFRVCIE